MSAGKYRKEHDCLNCGSHVEKHYCSSCGQPNLELKESLWQFISHSIAHYFHFDNKFFQTLVPLLSKPGMVTLNYLAGKRARYINPISMYIFVSIVYFLVVAPPKVKVEPNKTIQTATPEKQKAALQNAKKRIANAGIDSSIFVNKVEEAINEDIDRGTFKKLSFKDQEYMLKKLRTDYETKKTDELSESIISLQEIHERRNDSTYASYLARQKTLQEAEQDNMIERFMKKREIEVSQKSSALDEQVERNRSKQYFLFMPLMALFIMMNFRKNHIRYLDHLIFTIHGMTAFFIVLIFTQPLKKLLFASSSLISGLIELALIAWICWYLYKSLKIFYQRKTSTTIWRMIWVICLYSFTIKFSETIIREILFYFAT